MLNNADGQERAGQGKPQPSIDGGGENKADADAVQQQHGIENRDLVGEDAKLLAHQRATARRRAFADGQQASHPRNQVHVGASHHEAKRYAAIKNVS